MGAVNRAMEVLKELVRLKRLKMDNCLNGVWSDNVAKDDYEMCKSAAWRAAFALLAEGETTQEAPAEFAAWFCKNYPKDTIIFDPAWHAPRIYRAATWHASHAAPSPSTTEAQADATVLVERSIRRLHDRVACRDIATLRNALSLCAKALEEADLLGRCDYTDSEQRRLAEATETAHRLVAQYAHVTDSATPTDAAASPQTGDALSTQEAQAESPEVTIAKLRRALDEIWVVVIEECVDALLRGPMPTTIDEAVDRLRALKDKA